MPAFHICLHDATPAFARETESILRDLAPLVGRQLSCGVVPNWHNQWPLGKHPGYCELLTSASDELLLHGHSHLRRRGTGPVSALTGGADEMNGLSLPETRWTLERGQRMFVDVFGREARGFLAPAWQRGLVTSEPRGLTTSEPRGFSPGDNIGPEGPVLQFVLGFFSLDSRDGQRVPLATWSWDCGEPRWLGYVGQGVGWLMHRLEGRVPVLAIHPRDVTRGFWPTILRQTESLLEQGYTPSTLADLLEARAW